MSNVRQKSFIILYILAPQKLENIVKEKKLFTIILENIKYLGISLTEDI